MIPQLAPRSPSPTPSAVWPAPPSGLHIPFATDNTSEYEAQRGVDFLFANATSICLSTVTICSGLYLCIGICSALLHEILSLFRWYKDPRPGHSSKSTTNGPPPTRLTTNGNTSMTDQLKSQFPCVRLHNLAHFWPCGPLLLRTRAAWSSRRRMAGLTRTPRRCVETRRGQRSVLSRWRLGASRSTLA